MKEWILTKFYICIDIDDIKLGIVNIHFYQLVTELRPLNNVRISFLLNILSINEWILTKFCTCIALNNVSTQDLENE